MTEAVFGLRESTLLNTITVKMSVLLGCQHGVYAMSFAASVTSYYKFKFKFFIARNLKTQVITCIHLDGVDASWSRHQVDPPSSIVSALSTTTSRGAPTGVIRSQPGTTQLSARLDVITPLVCLL